MKKSIIYLVIMISFGLHSCELDPDFTTTIESTCSDSIQNGTETGVDCGGSCPDACPTCSDGNQNGDETGIDCGGSCDDCSTTYTIETQDWIIDQEGIIAENHELSVKVSNQNGEPVSGVLVDFDVTKGMGTVTDDVTNTDGIAKSTWTLGNSFEEQKVLASTNSNEIITVPVSFDIVTSKFMDERDGEVYKVVTIGSQVWMAENLNFAAVGSECPGDDTSLCDIYGRYYPFNVLTGESSSNNIPSGIKGLCPASWHIPSLKEYELLIASIGGIEGAGSKLKSTSELWLSGNSDATNSSGFNGEPGGFNEPIPGNGNFELGTRSNFYTCSEETTAKGIFLDLANFTSTVFFVNLDKNYAVPCRCVLD